MIYAYVYAYVNANLGPAAKPERQVAGLTFASDQARGTTITGSARFDNLLELVAKLALAGGELGVRVLQSGAGLQFQVYDPADRSASVLFSREAGSLLGYTYEAERPEASYIIGGGGEQGAERLFVECGSAEAITTYGARVESFLNVSTSDPGTTTATGALADPTAELTQAVETELAGKVAETT